MKPCWCFYFPPPAYTALNSALRDARVGMGEARPPLDNLDRSLEEPAGSASKLEQLEVLVAVLVLVLVALLCVWLWRLRRWWREQRERHVKVLDEIEMCEPASEPALCSLFWRRLMSRFSSSLCTRPPSALPWAALAGSLWTTLMMLRTLTFCR